jgi:hypothetical protein
MAGNGTRRRFVLIGGMPRSGTTLVKTIVGSHSRIAIPPGDFPFAERAVTGLGVEEIFAIFGKKETWKLWEVRDFSSVFHLEHGAAFRSTLIQYADALGKDLPGAKAPFAEFYLDQYEDWLSGDELRFLYMLRNPFDNLASLKHSHIHRDWQHFDDLLDVHARNWLRSVSIALARAHSDPERFLVMRYEDLVDDPVQHGDAICRFIGVDFEEESMLNRSGYAYHDTNTSFPEQYAARQNKSRYVYAAESRKGALSRAEIEKIGGLCGEVAASLGYADPDFVTSPPEQPERLNSPARVRRLVRRVFRRLKR